jgi:bacterioferritin-associated ferredoxin
MFAELEILPAWSGIDAELDDWGAEPDDPVVCKCLNVTESQVRLAIAAFGAKSIGDLGRFTGAGTGCTCCHSALRQILAQYRKVPCLQR